MWDSRCISLKWFQYESISVEIWHNLSTFRKNNKLSGFRQTSDGIASIWANSAKHEPEPHRHESKLSKMILYCFNLNWLVPYTMNQQHVTLNSSTNKMSTCLLGKCSFIFKWKEEYQLWRHNVHKSNHLPLQERDNNLFCGHIQSI